MVDIFKIREEAAARASAGARKVAAVELVRVNGDTNMAIPTPITAATDTIPDAAPVNVAEISNPDDNTIIANTAIRPAEGDAAAFRPSPAPLPKKPKIKVKISGEFGQMMTSFDDVVVDEKLIVLVVNLSDDNYYIPPTSERTPFDISIKGTTHTTINPGITFERDGAMYIILVKSQ